MTAILPLSALGWGQTATAESKQLTAEANGIEVMIKLPNPKATLKVDDPAAIWRSTKNKMPTMTAPKPMPLKKVVTTALPAPKPTPPPKKVVTAPKPKPPMVKPKKRKVVSDTPKPPPKLTKKPAAPKKAQVEAVQAAELPKKTEIKKIPPFEPEEESSKKYLEAPEISNILDNLFADPRENI